VLIITNNKYPASCSMNIWLADYYYMVIAN